MRNKMAIVKNVMNLRASYEALAQRDHGVEGMGLVHGFTGAGKTTAIAWLVNQVEGVYVRAQATWTPSAMLGALMQELGAAPIHRGSAAMVTFIVTKLVERGRPLFIDEADYLLGNLKMLESLRDIHDLSKSPVILIGMEGIEKRLVHRQQLARRITQWVEFLPADLDDARVLADTVCEVELDDDLLAALHAAAKGSAGLMVNGMARIEALAKANGWKKIDADRWGNRPFFLSQINAALKAVGAIRKVVG